MDLSESLWISGNSGQFMTEELGQALCCAVDFNLSSGIMERRGWGS